MCHFLSRQSGPKETPATWHWTLIRVQNPVLWLRCSPTLVAVLVEDVQAEESGKHKAQAEGRDASKILMIIIIRIRIMTTKMILIRLIQYGLGLKEKPKERRALRRARTELFHGDCGGSLACCVLTGCRRRHQKPRGTGDVGEGERDRRVSLSSSVPSAFLTASPSAEVAQKPMDTTGTEY